MNVLLIFFAIPIAVIILSMILETYMKSPFKVAGIFFSIFLVIAFYLGVNAESIVIIVVYTIISLISAYITELIRNRKCMRVEQFPRYYREGVNRNSEQEFELPENNDFLNLEIENTPNTCYRRRR